MSAVATLNRADENLARTIDAVTEAVGAVGTKTAAARDRLAAALDAARDRLAETMRDVAAMLGLTADAFDVAAGCELLALPEPQAHEQAHEQAHDAEPAALDLETPAVPDTADMDTFLANAEAAGWDGPRQEDSYANGAKASEAHDIKEAAPANRVAELALASRTAEAVDESSNHDKGLDALCDKAAAMPNGKSKTKRRR